MSIFCKCWRINGVVPDASSIDQGTSRKNVFRDVGNFPARFGFIGLLREPGQHRILNGYWFDMLWSSLTITPVLVLLARDWAPSDRAYLSLKHNECW